MFGNKKVCRVVPSIHLHRTNFRSNLKEKCFENILLQKKEEIKQLFRALAAKIGQICNLKFIACKYHVYNIPNTSNS